jgi:hypothetical protein
MTEDYMLLIQRNIRSISTFRIKKGQAPVRHALHFKTNQIYSTRYDFRVRELAARLVLYYTIILSSLHLAHVQQSSGDGQGITLASPALS